jgi:hypothetical protein
MAERADPLGRRIDRVAGLGVLSHEHRVRRVARRSGHFPVKLWVVRERVQVSASSFDRPPAMAARAGLVSG